jgi:hypothetical protein
MATHVRVIAAIFLVVGVFGLVTAILSTILFGVLATAAGMSGDTDAPIGGALLGLAGAALSLALLTFAVPAILCSWGLFTFRGWARILAIVLAVIAVIQFPLGTLFGVYALFILFQKDTEALFATPGAAGR